MKKKLLLFLTLLLIATCAMSQIKITPSGNVYIGPPDITWVGCKLKINYGANNITFMPDWSGANIGVSIDRLDFWHPVKGWNKVRFKTYTLSSDSTVKTDIRSIENATSILQRIRTYSYYFISDSIEIKSDSIDLRKRDYGVLAQQVQEILPDLVDTAKGTMFVNYNAFIGFLIAGFNEQQTLIESLQSIILAQEQDLIKLTQNLAYLQEWVQSCCGTPKGKIGQQSTPHYEEQEYSQEKAFLFQNTPNPFSSNTEIICQLPKTVKNAVIYIYNLQGVELKHYTATQTGLNTITVNGSELTAGMYLYTLVVDNEIIDTKRMILTK